MGGLPSKPGTRMQRHPAYKEHSGLVFNQESGRSFNRGGPSKNNSKKMMSANRKKYIRTDTKTKWVGF
jgi:hypothetical protein